MGMLDTASAWLDTTLASTTVAGVSVTIRDGAATSDSVIAVVGQTVPGFDLGNGIVQSWETTDFLIAASSFIIDSGATLPAVGMVIVRTINSREVQYEVTNADDGRCYRFCDGATRDMLRIHTREISRRVG